MRHRTIERNQYACAFIYCYFCVIDVVKYAFCEFLRHVERPNIFSAHRANRTNRTYILECINTTIIAKEREKPSARVCVTVHGQILSLYILLLRSCTLHPSLPWFGNSENLPSSGMRLHNSRLWMMKKRIVCETSWRKIWECVSCLCVRICFRFSLICCVFVHVCVCVLCWRAQSTVLYSYGCVQVFAKPKSEPILLLVAKFFWNKRHANCTAVLRWRCRLHFINWIEQIFIASVWTMRFSNHSFI